MSPLPFAAMLTMRSLRPLAAIANTRLPSWLSTASRKRVSPGTGNTARRIDSGPNTALPPRTLSTAR